MISLFLDLLFVESLNSWRIIDKFRKINLNSVFSERPLIYYMNIFHYKLVCIMKYYVDSNKSDIYFYNLVTFL